MNIDELKKETSSRLKYAEHILNNRQYYKLIRHDGLWTSCDFCGYIIASISNRTDGFAIYIQDADDAFFERVFDTESKALKIFDEFFSCKHPFFDEDMRKLLTMYGFSG